jgi:L-cysteate sulfo-lyase
MALTRFPRFPLAHLPTPLQPLPALSAYLGGPKLYIKRDDCTGLALGGNKTRKLEFLLAEALIEGATTIVSEGGLQSNHVRQTAAASAKAGLKCELVLDRNVRGREPAYETSGNLLLDRLLNAMIHICEAGEARADRVARVMEVARQRGERPYHIPTGGSNATGALGYVDCMLELVDQARQSNLAIDAVVLASGSGGTQGGMVLGLAESGTHIRGIGIDIDDDPPVVLADVRRIARDGAAKLGIEPIDDDKITLETGHATPGYGQPNAGMIEAVKLTARLEAILLDPVYTGKGMAGLIGMIRAGRFRADETVVFVHTGGMPALFAYPSTF